FLFLKLCQDELPQTVAYALGVIYPHLKRSIQRDGGFKAADSRSKLRFCLSDEFNAFFFDVVVIRCNWKHACELVIRVTRARVIVNDELQVEAVTLLHISGFLLVRQEVFHRNSRNLIVRKRIANECLSVLFRVEYIPVDDDSENAEYPSGCN